MKRVVITGMGAYACIGQNLEEVKESLYQGKSGIGIEEIRKEVGYRSPLTGIVERPQLKGKIERRLRVGLAEEAEYAYVSAVEALGNANIDM
jgi:3-oxoacyl-[acyl-carrier-protein] synthase-1